MYSWECSPKGNKASKAIVMDRGNLCTGLYGYCVSSVKRSMWNWRQSILAGASHSRSSKMGSAARLGSSSEIKKKSKDFS